MSQITIDARDARLAVLGYQPEVKRIYWSALPEKLPTYGQTLDLTGCEITAIYADGSEAVVTPYCTFSPDTGATVPNANTLTVTATYTARSGKVCEADETLPICIPAYIKVIVPETVPVVYEGAYAQSRSWAKTVSFFGIGDVYACLYWTRGGEVVAISKVPATFSELTGFYGGGGVFGVAHNLSSATYTRYYTPTRTEEETVDYYVQIKATYTIYGVTLEDIGTLEADIVKGIRLRGVPTVYSGIEPVTLTKSENIRIEYMSGVIKTCAEATERGTGFKDSFWGPDTYNITIGDAHSGSVPLTMTSFPTSPENSSSFDCADGVVTWTNII